MPQLLAFDTAGFACSVAVIRDGAVRAHRRAEMARGQAEALVPMILEVLAEADAGFDDLDGLAVTVGPGSFTGLRIGLATARGIVTATGLPAMGLTTLEAVLAGRPETERDGRDVLVALDSKRRDPYVQLFAGDGTPRSRPQAVLPAQVPPLVAAQPVWLAGDGVEGIAAALDAADIAYRRSAANGSVDAPVLAALAESRWPPDAAALPLAPVYLRPPDTTGPASAPAVVGIEPMGPAHAELLSEIHGRCFEERWNAAAFAGQLALPTCLGFIATMDAGEPAGFVLGQSAGASCDIVTLCVLPEFRRRGAATRLLSAFLEALRGAGAAEVFLEVAADNGAAKGLYRKFGFMPVGRRPKYYRLPNGGGDAFVYRLALDASDASPT